MPDGVHPTPQACEIMSRFDQHSELKNEIKPAYWLARNSATPSVLDKKHPKTGCPFIVILTADQARNIYLLRSASTAEGPAATSVSGKSSLVAELFGVSPKTIRDVWNRKTWTQVTRSLWSEGEACLHEREHMTPEQRAAAGDTEPFLLKRRGRPPGSKDARPRKRRYPFAEDEAPQPLATHRATIAETPLVASHSHTSYPPYASRTEPAAASVVSTGKDVLPERSWPCHRLAAAPGLIQPPRQPPSPHGDARSPDGRRHLEQ
eukprot:CAMPEP_0172184708 /NCGR_PEP_ID=MMETSP1050-20130122/19733_1 /TAXON_ID=233186 /ORGANISM="Cryptomonas curvata, Strain CCAP979/52" /LENGTH=262 /DNA_ID=CAMNT_0012858551 /DNA_START=163 /DNA_END=948 /DNA_ORIENTATION=+